MRCFRVVLIVRTNEEMVDVGTIAIDIEQSITHRNYFGKCDLVQIQELGK